MFHPSGPNNLLSCTTAWKNDNPNKIFLYSAGFLVTFKRSLFNLKYALRRFALRPTEGKSIKRKKKKREMADKKKKRQEKVDERRELVRGISSIKKNSIGSEMRMLCGQCHYDFMKLIIQKQ